MGGAISLRDPVLVRTSLLPNRRTKNIGCGRGLLHIARNLIMRTLDDRFLEIVMVWCCVYRLFEHTHTRTYFQVPPELQLYVSSHIPVVRGTGSLVYVHSDLTDLVFFLPCSCWLRGLSSGRSMTLISSQREVPA